MRRLQTAYVRCRRRGVAYLVVLGAAMLVAVLGMASLTAMRIERKAVENVADAAEARLIAQAAVEIGLQRIADDPTWRTTYTNGTWLTDIPLGNGRFTLAGIDPDDGDLGNSESHGVVLVGTGSKGRAVQKAEVTLVPKLQGLGCLTSAMHAGGSITFTAVVVQSDKTVSSNESISGSSATVNSPVEAAIGVSGGTFNGGQSSGVDARSMPLSTVFDQYVASATEISIGSLPQDDGVRMLENRVLSSASNPFGTANSQGIYIIDCLGQTIHIRSSRIVGTLILRNVGADSTVEDSVNWSVAIANYPALLVQGDFKLELHEDVLSESDEGVNFNPSGTPYEGSTDSDTSDTYPSKITGLVYVSGNLALEGENTIEGVLVAGGTISATGEATLAYNDVYYTNPPPGFLDTTLMKFSPGSWQRGVE
jgi:hypothetical protein